LLGLLLVKNKKIGFGYSFSTTSGFKIAPPFGDHKGLKGVRIKKLQ